MKKHIMLGFLADDEEAERLVKNALEEQGIIAELMRKHTKLGVRAEVQMNSQIDTLIIVENLETARPYTPDDINELIDIRDDLTIILVIPSERKGSHYVEQLYVRGMYTAIFDSDSSFFNIAELIKNGRKKKSAKIYYGIDVEPAEIKLEDKGIIDANKAKQVLSYLKNDIDGEFKDRLEHVHRMLTSSEFISFLRLLPEEVKSEIKEVQGYEDYFLKDFEKKETPKGKRLLTVPKFLNKIKNVMNKPVSIPLKKKNKDEFEEKNSIDVDKAIKANDEEPAKEDSLEELNIEPIERADEPIQLLNEEVIQNENKIIKDVDSHDEVSKEEAIKEENNYPKQVKGEKKKINFFQKKNKLENKLSLNITLSVAICSLDNGVGCSHIAKSLAYYIKNVLKKKVCIVDFKGTLVGMKGIEVFSKENIYQLYDKFDFIILDIGKYKSSLENEIKRAPLKLMSAFYDEDYICTLAEFIKNEENPQKWKYIFNHVPENKKKKVEALMEDYEYWCMPTFDAESPDKEVETIFYRLLQGGKL